MRKYKLGINKNDYEAEVKKMTAEKAVVVVNGREYAVQIRDFGKKASSDPVRRSPSAPPSVTPPSPPPVSTGAAPSGSREGVTAPLPGSILDIKVSAGQTVRAGQDLLVMEAMKMENVVQAPYDGQVKKIQVSKGDSVAENDLLIEISRSPISSL